MPDTPLPTTTEQDATSHLRSQSLDYWGQQFGIESKEVERLVQAALKGIVTSDPIVEQVGHSSEAGIARSHRLQKMHIERELSQDKEVLLNLSEDIQARVRGLLAGRKRSKNTKETLSAKEINTLILDLNYYEIKLLIGMVREEHPGWFQESEFSTGGRKSWQLQRKHRESFLAIARPYVDILLGRRNTFDHRESRRSGQKSTTANTAGLIGWGKTGYEDLVDGHY